jgi:diguanylate cyclase (GGDEF)-like protein
MTLWQMTYSISTVLTGLIIAPQISIFFLSHLIVIFTFATLRSQLYELIIAWIITAIAIAIIVTYNHNAILTLNYDKPVEYLLISLSFLLFLLRASALGFYGHRLILRMINRRQLFEFETSDDALAGAYNRQNLDSILSVQINHYEQRAIPCCLARVDVDNFKQSSFKIDSENNALQNIVSILRKEVRKSDILIRYGVEEFIIIMTATNLEEAKHNIQNIRNKIEQFESNQDCKNQPLTITVGITQLIDHDHPEDIINRADYALYSAKQKGKNLLAIQCGLPFTPT